MPEQWKNTLHDKLHEESFKFYSDSIDDGAELKFKQI